MKDAMFESSLAYMRPDIANEWMYEKNGDMQPEYYSCGSHQNVFWKCTNGHIWDAQIRNRVKGSGCPYCCGRRVLKGYNDFESKCADKLHMWNYDKNTDMMPDEIYYRSGKKVWWICKKGHEWDATPYAIFKGGGCPYCSSERLLKGFNDLETLYPDICDLWDYELNVLKPSDVFPKSAKRIHWICSKGHRWDVSVHHVVNGGGSCPVCSKKRMAKGVNDFETVASKALLAEWDYNKNLITPDQISAHNNKHKVWWLCSKCGGEWEETVHKRLDRGYKCPYCMGKTPIKGKNDLATVCPEIISWWSKENDKLPNEYTRYSHKKVKWTCPTCKLEFQRSIKNHSEIGTCPYCTGIKVQIGKNDLATKQPFLKKEWNYKRNRLGPEQSAEHSNKKVWWTCSICGNEWMAFINNRSKGKRCPKCNPR